MIQINRPNTPKLFASIGIIFSLLLLFNFNAHAQITVSSSCGITASSSPYAGTSSIYQINLAVPGTWWCDNIMFTYNGANLRCDVITSSIPFSGCNNGAFTYSGNSNTPENLTFYLDTRKNPYELTNTPPTDNSIEIQQTPQNLVPDGNSVTFTAETVLLSGATAVGYQWYRDGVAIPGAVSKTLSETPPHNGTIYYVEVQLSDATTLQSVEKKVLLTSAQDGRFVIGGAASATITALDECLSIYELDITITGDLYYSQFSLSENGTQLTQSTLSLNGVPYVNRWNNNNMVYEGVYPPVSRIKCYLNTRNGIPYELTGSLPYFDPNYLEIKLTADKNFINKGESVQLTAEACPTGIYTYEWYENDVLMIGKSGEVITVSPDKNGNDYKVVVNGTESNTETILFADACDNRFSINQWYNRAQLLEACAVDECHAVYRLKLDLQKDAHFALLLDGTPVEALIDWDLPTIRAEKSGAGTPGFRQSSGDAVITCYLDLRQQYGDYNVLSAAKPARNVPFVLATAVGGSQIARCAPIEITSCPNEPHFTYRWYKNDVPFGNSATLNDPTPVAGDRYYLVINEGTAEELTSNTITITYHSDPPLPGTTTLSGYSEQLNWYEHSVKDGDMLTFTVRPHDPIIKTYTLQYKSLAVGSQWRDTTIVPVIGANVVFTFKPEFGAKYRIKGVDNGACNQYYSDSSLVRFIYDCVGGDSWDLFSEDFGHFQSGRYYYDYDPVNKQYRQSTTNNLHSMYLTGTYWVADPYIPSRVKNHDFAWNYGGVDGGWTACINNGGKRIEDGYYAITNNPASGDCGNLDYWKGTDHSGNTNGGMLFVNVGGSALNEVVYEQEITIAGGCKDVKVLFSAFISNATIKGETPVDVRLDILNADKSKTLYSISSGEILTRSQADVNAGKAWANLSFKFDAEENAVYYMQLTNNAPSGSGNDILIDDISVTICVPKIELELIDLSIIDFGTAVDIGVCMDDVIVPLEAKLTVGSGSITDLFPSPKYQFQYRKNNGAWVNFGNSGNTVDIHLLHSENVFRGYTQWRIIVAGSQSTIDKVGKPEEDGGISKPSCSDMYLQSNIITVDFDHKHYDDIAINECFGQIYQLTVPIPERGSFTWCTADEHGNPTGAWSTPVQWTETKPTVTIPLTAPNTTTPQKYVFRPISPYDCRFDYVVTITGRDCDDLVLKKTASVTEINAGDTFTYTLTLENKSKFAMEDVIVTDKLPAQMEYKSSNPSAGTYNATNGEWNIGAMASGAKATLTITVRNISGAGSTIINQAFVSKRTKKADRDETLTFPNYNTAKNNNPSFADDVAVYVNPVEAPGIIGNQPCKDDVITYSLNTSHIQLTARAKYQWSILPANSGVVIQGSTTKATLDVKYYNAPATYMILCEITPDSTIFDPPITQSKCVYVTDVPNVAISGKIHVCYGDIEKYTAITDNTPRAAYSWKLLSNENQLIIDGANAQTATVEWLRSNGGAITTDRLLVEAVNTITYEAAGACEQETVSCSNSAFLDVFIHVNPPAEFRYENNNMMYFQSEPSYRHTDSIYTDILVEFINESHLAGNTRNVDYYWDFAGDGAFTQTSYDATHTYRDVGNYTVQLYAVDTIWGCRTRIDKPLAVLPNPNCIATFPNAFTPAKTTNNVFGALYTNGVLLEGFELRVFDRWGAMVWSTNDPHEYWDGMYKGSMGKQDVYVYHCKALCQDIDPKTGNRKTLSIKGDVTLIR